MKTIVQTITLKSDQHYGRKAPPGPLGELLRELPHAVRQSIRMAFTGRSRSRGKSPAWLLAASDIRLVDYSGNDETVLHFEVPPLGEAAAELYQQQELWPTKPDANDTGFDTLADVICDVAANNLDSDKFDRPLLGRLIRFRKTVHEAFQEISITGNRYTPDHPCVLNESIIETAKCLYSNTPPSQQTRVVGNLDMIRASTQTFALKLDDGEEIRGVLVAGEFGELTNLFQNRVMVLGKAIYRASGRLLRIDADEVTPASDEDRFFSTVPQPTRQKLDVRQVLREQQHKKGLAAIFGKWPGDETEEEIEQALQELS
ncbi:MAG: hypothetical protein IID46_16355 [Planctomycetes bacterium]|nr:hypothetical protein [Planctomycetota bacterium]